MINKLIEVQNALKAPKNQYNVFGEYYYRSCEDILEAVKPLLQEKGLLLTITDDIVLVGDRYYVKATATITDGTNTILTSAFARETLDKKKSDVSQITGATSSYARKYALNGLFCIDDNKDADNAIPDKIKQQFVCKGCGKPFLDVEVNGKICTAEYQYNNAIQVRGGPYCKDCHSKRKNISDKESVNGYTRQNN